MKQILEKLTRYDIWPSHRNNHADDDALELQIDQEDGGKWLKFEDVEAALAQVSAWQPIETAPKDGTEILCFDPTESGTTAILRWDAFGSGAWRVAYWCHRDDHSLDWEPTHWMPLPEPPTQGVN